MTIRVAKVKEQGFKEHPTPSLHTLPAAICLVWYLSQSSYHHLEASPGVNYSYFQREKFVMKFHVQYPIPYNYILHTAILHFPLYCLDVSLQSIRN